MLEKGDEIICAGAAAHSMGVLARDIEIGDVILPEDFIGGPMKEGDLFGVCPVCGGRYANHRVTRLHAGGKGWDCFAVAG